MDVAAGTTDARRRDVGPFAVSDVAFARDTTLSQHEHPRSCLAVVVAGAVRKTYARETHDAVRATVIAMPAGEPHSDLFGSSGARIVVVEGDETIDRTRVFSDWGAAALAHRVSRELALSDEFSELALEGLALELTAHAARCRSRIADRRLWVDAAAEILRERFRDPPSALELAQEVGVHPSHLARGFRARFGENLGAYVRNVRLDWAADRLVRTDVALARIACEAGFADQSHFTRSFAGRFGLPPGRYRAAHR
ncbi:MAG TPA: AraC family transcriptional regulator [Gaiellaceae bacterium]|nr:AraC family transcriptional regulator [Gaiellaceae bacterium]